MTTATEKSYVVLIRGVTPTGKNKVPMAKPREALGETPLGEVRTYIQSGNVLTRSALTAGEVEEGAHNTILEHFGGDLVIVAKTPAQFQTHQQRTYKSVNIFRG